MNEPPVIETKAGDRAIMRLLKTAAGLFLLLVLFLMLAPLILGSGVIETALVLPLGWLRFLQRTVPQISWNWDLVGMAVVSGVAILILAQALFAWGTRRIAQARGQNWKWPWKWTCSGLFAILLLFLVGMSVGGATHQIGWIAFSPEPWLEEKRGRWRDVTEMRWLEIEFGAAIEGAGNLASLREKVSKQPVYFSRSRPALARQSYHFLVVTTEAGQIEGTIIFPRNAERFADVGGIHTFGGQKGEPFPARDLPALLEKHRNHLFAF
jgi:hypothetical protein